MDTIEKVNEIENEEVESQLRQLAELALESYFQFKAEAKKKPKK